MSVCNEIVNLDCICYIFGMTSASNKETLKSKKPAETLSKKPISDCTRCGTCCKKGGPSFHHADKSLIEEGVIHSKFLYTIRKDELAYDNVRQCLEPVSTDVIKIKGQKDSLTCIFFNERQSACTIYENRPLECRALKCWDTKGLEDLYAKQRLTRKDLLSEIDGLWSLIKDHQERCNYKTIHRLVNAIKRNAGGDARQKLFEIIQFDTEIRKLVVSTAGLDAEMLDFLFGRPLNRTIKKLGLKVRQNDKKNISFQTLPGKNIKT
jgi:Fe-S-cluster containining protein